MLYKVMSISGSCLITDNTLIGIHYMSTQSQLQSYITCSLKGKGRTRYPPNGSLVCILCIESNWHMYCIRRDSLNSLHQHL